MKRVIDVQVKLRNKTFTTDFLVLESCPQGNIVLGRSFLQSAGALINVAHGYIHFCSPINRRFKFPLKEKDVLIGDFDGEDIGKAPKRLDNWHCA